MRASPHRRAPLWLAVLAPLLLNIAILGLAWAFRQTVVPGWKKGPLIDPAAPYAPENAAPLFAAAALITLNAYFVVLAAWRRRRAAVWWLPWVALAGSLLLAEAAIRAWLAVDMVTYFRPHATLHWQVRPDLREFRNNKGAGTITTNADGMRSVSEARQKPAGTFRVLVLGDSSNFGHGVEGHQMWSEVLEGILDARQGGGRIEVLNGACPGWTTYQALVFLQETGLAYQPDLVIAGFNNDPGPEYFGDEQRVPPEPLRSANALLFRSEVYLLAREVVLCLTRRLHGATERRYAARQAGQEPNYAELGPEEATGLVPRVSLERFQQNLRRLHELGAERGYRFVWLNMPINRTLPELVERYVDPDYRAAAAQLSHELGFVLEDIDDYWLRSRAWDLHIDGHVFHPSAAGHRLLAQQVAGTLIGQGMIPGAQGAVPMDGPPPATQEPVLRLGISSLTPIHAHIGAVLEARPDLAAAHGLQLQLHHYRSGKDQGSDVARGALDAFFTCEVPTVKMLARRPDLRVVASPGALGRIGVLARKDRADSLQQLRGARVGLSPGSTPAMDWQRWGAGLQAEEVALRTEELEQALRSGQVDAVISWDPWLELWLQAAPDELQLLQQRPFYSDLALSIPWAALEPGRGRQLVATLEQALQVAAADRVRYDEAVSRSSGWPLSVVAAVADRNAVLAGGTASFEVGPQNYQTLQRALQFAGAPASGLAELVWPGLLDGKPPPPPKLGGKQPSPKPGRPPPGHAGPRGPAPQ